MMNADSPNEKLGDSLDLREISIDFIKSLQLLLDELLYQSLGIAVCEVYGRIKLLCIFNCTSTTESKYNAW